MMPLPPRVLFSVIVERCSFADSVLARDQQHCVWIDNRDRDHLVLLVRTNSPDADRVSALIAQLLFVKAQAHSFLRDQNDLVVAIRQLRVDQAIVLFDLDRDDAAFANVAVIGEIRFLDDARLRREHDVEIFVPGLIDRVRPGADFFD